MAKRKGPGRAKRTTRTTPRPQPRRVLVRRGAPTTATLQGTVRGALERRRMEPVRAAARRELELRELDRQMEATDPTTVEGKLAELDRAMDATSS